MRRGGGASTPTPPPQVPPAPSRSCRTQRPSRAPACSAARDSRPAGDGRSPLWRVGDLFRVARHGGPSLDRLPCDPPLGVLRRGRMQRRSVTLGRVLAGALLAAVALGPSSGTGGGAGVGSPPSARGPPAARAPPGCR